MPRFLVCIHDATPAYAGETRAMIRDLAPLLGRRVSFGVVPDWHGRWPLAEHPHYCRLLRDSSHELLLHGCVHRRQRGAGPVSWLAEGADEMNGLDVGETRRTIERAQRTFTAMFGAPARGFVAPAWQRGRVRPGPHAPGVDHVLGFFSVESQAGRTVPLATWTWDCGRWPWLGHIGHALGWLLHSAGRGVPALAVHPRDLGRGFWPAVLHVIEDLLARGYEPITVAGLVGTNHVEVDA